MLRRIGLPFSSLRRDFNTLIKKDAAKIKVLDSSNHNETPLGYSHSEYIEAWSDAKKRGELDIKPKIISRPPLVKYWEPPKLPS